MGSSVGRVLVSLVTWNDADWLPGCLGSIRSQTIPVAVRAFDNGSEDETVAMLEAAGCDVGRSSSNLGFSKGHNANLAPLDFDFALILNADLRLAPDFVERLVAGFEKEDRIGMAGGKLLRMGPGGVETRINGVPVIDSAGIYFTPSQRHFDRGSGRPDRGEYGRPELVFGITGAAMMVSRPLVEDLEEEGEFFDEDFFAYREDADLSWRVQLRGWKVLYEPTSRAWHFRRGGHGSRPRLSPAINYHSVKNRFLMRTKNMDRAVRRRCFPWMLLRDAGILAYVLSIERSSAGALVEARRLRPRMLEKRRVIQSRRLVSPAEIRNWFAFQPVSRPLG